MHKLQQAAGNLGATDERHFSWFGLISSCATRCVWFEVLLFSQSFQVLESIFSYEKDEDCRKSSVGLSVRPSR